MIYQLNFEMIKNHLFEEKKKDEPMKLRHRAPIKAKILPFSTKFNEKHLDFNGFLGDVLRKAINKQGPNEENENIFDNIFSKFSNISELSTSEKNKIRTFFEELYFEDNNLIFVHPKLAFWLKEGNNKEIAQFMVDILIGQKEKEGINHLYQKEEKNQLTTKILLDSLAPLRESNLKSSYTCVLPFIKERFQNDFDFILSNEDLFLESFDLFIKFYYFMYTSQLILKLRQFEKATPNNFDEIYFNLNWEKSSKSRESYQKGWEKLKKASVGIFTHRNLLEILNLSNIDQNFMYWDFKDDFIENQDDFINQLDEIIEWYKSNVDVKFDFIEKNEKKNIIDKIKEFYYVIDYQFLNSSRKKPYDDYKKFYVEFAKNDFCKRRGSLGHTLNITEDLFFLLLKLSIKNKEKIRLKDMYLQFEKRGVFLDKDSKEKIEEFLEKLNLLEKKSDSGDAVYVKSIL